MKFWTVQKKEIINVVDKNGIFYSDFAKSKNRSSDYTIFYTPTNSFYILLCKRIRKNNRWHQDVGYIG